jgi:outer membrane lipoprotein LolB
VRQLGWLAVIALSGCATLTSDRDNAGGPVDWAARNASLSAIEQWEFTGRLAVKDLVNGGGTQANVRWQQDAQNSRIRLSGPFGAAAHEIFWEPDRLSVVDKDGEQAIAYQGAQAAEQFLTEQLGWSFPAESTRYWLRALRDPSAAGEEVFDQNGNLTELHQHGWQISYERYLMSDGISLPSRLVMQNASARLRIVINKWHLSAASDRPS